MRVDIKLTVLKNPYGKVARQNRARRLKGTEENIESYPIVNDSYVQALENRNYLEERKRKQFLKKQLKKKNKLSVEEQSGLVIYLLFIT